MHVKPIAAIIQHCYPSAKFLIVIGLQDSEFGTGKRTGFVNVILSHYLYGSSLLATNLHHVPRLPTPPGCYYLTLHWNY